MLDLPDALEPGQGELPSASRTLMTVAPGPSTRVNVPGSSAPNTAAAGGGPVGTAGYHLGMAIPLGTRHVWTRIVEPDMTADRWGNEGVEVLATPHLVGLFEATAVRAIRDLYEPGQASVGTLVNIRHLRATPVGDTVTLSAEVTEVDGRRLGFHVRAEDSGGLAGEGTHERYLVDLDRFLQKTYGARASTSG